MTDPLDLSAIPLGTRVMAWMHGLMQHAIVVEPIPGEETSPGYISVRFEPPVPDGRPGEFTTRLSTDQPASIQLGWPEDDPQVTD